MASENTPVDLVYKAGETAKRDNSATSEHLIPFKPGQSGNPAGRPKGCKNGLRAQLLRLVKNAPTGSLKKVAEEYGIGDAATVAQVIVAVLSARGAGGDLQAIKLMFEQTEEPLKTTVDLQTSDGPIGISITEMRRKFAEAVEAKALEKGTADV